MKPIRFPICMLVTVLWVFSGRSAQSDDSGFPPWIQEMRAELKQLPNDALLDSLRISKLPSGSGPLLQNSPEAVRLDSALSILLERGLGIEEVHALVDMIKTNDCAVLPGVMSSISQPVYASEATPSELAVVDELLKQLPPLLDQDVAGCPAVYVVMAIGRLIQHPDSVATDDEDVWPEVPYRNTEVLEVLVKALSDARFFVREEAARTLGFVGANDPNLAPGVITVLEHQIEEEGRGAEYDQRQATMNAMISARDRIGKRIQQYLEKGGQIVEPEAWPPIGSLAEPQTSNRLGRDRMSTSSDRNGVVPRSLSDEHAGVPTNAPSRSTIEALAGQPNRVGVDADTGVESEPVATTGRRKLWLLIPIVLTTAIVSLLVIGARKRS